MEKENRMQGREEIDPVWQAFKQKKGEISFEMDIEEVSIHFIRGDSEQSRVELRKWTAYIFMTLRGASKWRKTRLSIFKPL